MVSFGSFEQNTSMFCLVATVCDLVHDVETIHDHGYLKFHPTPSENSELYEFFTFQVF